MNTAICNVAGSTIYCGIHFVTALFYQYLAIQLRKRLINKECYVILRVDTSFSEDFTMCSIIAKLKAGCLNGGGS
jgi:hypothetical protein